MDSEVGSPGTGIFGNSSSAANRTRSRLPSTLFFRFLGLCCKPAPPVRRGPLEVSRKAIFLERNMHVLDFSTEMQNTKNSVILLKKQFHHRRSPSNFENSRNKQRTHLRWSQFSVQLQVDGLDNSNFFKGTLLKTFYDNFSKLSFKSSFSNIPSKMYGEIFLEPFGY